MKKSRLLLLTSIILIIVFSLTACNITIEDENEWAEDLDLLKQVLDYIDAHYIEGLDINSADVYAAYAVAGGLDSFSYLTDGLGVAGDTAGIGIILSISPYKEYRISAIIENSPAAEIKDGGFQLMRGDHIYAVNGERVEGLGTTDFHNYSVGAAGTALELTIKRNGVILGETYTYTKVDTTFPEALYIDNLGDEIDNNLGYIQLRSFTNNAAEDFAECMTEWEADENEGLILDLRNNAGGSSAILADIASYFVPIEGNTPQTILELDYKEQGVEKQMLVKVEDNNYIDCPLIILTNSNSASAAEALIGAARAFNTDNTVIIGQPTYGKGVFQNAPFMLFDKRGEESYAYYISIVTGYYYIVDEAVEGGRYNIHKNPIEPDVQIEPTETLGELFSDNEIIAANNYFVSLAE